MSRDEIGAGEMTGVEPPSGYRNPFRSTAVADTTLVGRNPDAAEPSVPTAAHRAAFAALRSYLDLRPGADHPGQTIMLSGDYGSGKTHLLVRMLDTALRSVEDQNRVLYVTAGQGGFKELFHAVLHAVGKEGLARQMGHYYADAIAAELAANDTPQEYLDTAGGDRIRAMTPEVVPSKIARRVHEHLREVTGNGTDTAVADAMWLLVKNTDLLDPVWDWLHGAEPAAALTNRKIIRTIGTELEAIEALGALAQVLGGRLRQFVLAVDEMSGIFARSTTPAATLAHALQALLETAVRSGSCFILCGLPDLLDSVGPGVAGRIDAHVELDGFTADDITRLILDAHQATLGRRALAPFDDDCATIVRDYTGGNPRRVIRLLHEAFKLATEDLPDVPAGTPPRPDGTQEWVARLPRITDDLLYEAAQDSVTVSFDTVLKEIGVVARRNRWWLVDELNTPLDATRWREFRVSTRHGASDHAVLVARSLLAETEIAELRRWVAAVRPSGRPMALVCASRPGEAAVTAVVPLLGAPPIVRSRGFEADLTIALSPDDPPVAEAQGALTQVNRTLIDLTAQVAALSHSRELVPDRIAEEIAERVAGRIGPGEEPGDALPAEVAGAFDLVTRRLDRVMPVTPIIRAAFAAGGYEATMPVRGLLFGQTVREALGTGLLVRVYVAEFRAAVAGWFGDRTSAEDSVTVLLGVCETFQAMVDKLNLRPLENLAGVADAPEPAIGEPLPVAELTDSLGLLARQVREAALAAVERG